MVEIGGSGEEDRVPCTRSAGRSMKDVPGRP